MPIETQKLEFCVGCGGNQFNFLLETDDFQGKTGRYSIQTCQDCDVSLTSPRPTIQALPKLYEGQDSGVDLSTKSGLSLLLKKGKLKGYVKRLLKFQKKPFVVYDVGCGDALLAAILAKSPRCQLSVALDFSLESPDIFRTLERPTNLRYVPFDLMETSSLPKADLIVMRHVLEHVLDPVAYLKSLSSYLKPDGKFIIEIPNRDTIWLKVFGKHYNQLALPYHLSHFNEKSFRTTFGKEFPIISISKANVPVLGPSLSVWWRAWQSNIGILAAIFYPIQLLIDKLSGTSTALLIEMGPAN
jgi:SAM-dependent methyltransferase